ncbi:serine hydroxymethyltransferase [Haloplanus halophilus]|uniref:serine hydroxymethyltransferase n=1 Tax=Haloplanus halophilus TaxID=2949993 RepID=UPI00203B7404|nr:serine hydroxymethyltransferase [Haloplanus sp. GDY1]
MEYENVERADRAVAEAIRSEARLQDESLMMIASENVASPAVREAQGSILTNRNALGYPDSRLYPGSENIDEVEALAIAYSKELWGADHVNVQPHSGSLANLAVYLAVLDPGDRLLALHPRDGGHITHGSDLHLSGDLYETHHYELDPETGRLDYEAIARRAEEVDPDMIISGYSAYPRTIDWERFQEIAASVDAYHLADIAHLSGLIATGVFPSPVGVAEFCTGSTYKTIKTGRGGIILCDEEYGEAVDEALFPRLQGGAAMPNIAGKAAGLAEALDDEFDDYVDRTVADAEALADALAERGVDVVTGGTDTHIVLVDLRGSHSDLPGSEAERALEAAGIVANKASVPGDPRYPSDASGIRFGTTSLAARGFEGAAMDAVADLIVRALDSAGDEGALEELSAEVATLCE